MGELSSYGYKVFLDLSDENGLKGGNFQKQLMNALDKASIFVPIITPAPSGPPGTKEAEMGYFEAMQYKLDNGGVDWCHEEIKQALKKLDSKLILPLYRKVDLSKEYKFVPDDIASFRDLNARILVDELFNESIHV